MDVEIYGDIDHSDYCPLDNPEECEGGCSLA